MVLCDRSVDTQWFYVIGLLTANIPCHLSVDPQWFNGIGLFPPVILWGGSVNRKFPYICCLCTLWKLLLAHSAICVALSYFFVGQMLIVSSTVFSHGTGERDKDRTAAFADEPKNAFRRRWRRKSRQQLLLKITTMTQGWLTGIRL